MFDDQDLDLGLMAHHGSRIGTAGSGCENLSKLLAFDLHGDKESFLWTVLIV